jgi:hypothetical protein
MSGAISPRGEADLSAREGQMLERWVMVLPVAMGLASAAAAADFDPQAAHAGFIDAFNNRDWAAVKA